MLFLAITSGFLGSLTTFSSWQLSSTLSLFFEANLTTAILSYLLIEIGGAVLYLASFYFGNHLSRLIEMVIHKDRHKTEIILETESFVQFEQEQNDSFVIQYGHGELIAIIIALFCWLLWVLFVLLSIFEETYRTIWLSSCFAPIGKIFSLQLFSNA